MDHPWGISGPGFLWLYGVALVAAIGLAAYLRWRDPRLAEPLPVGDANMVAYLVGGPTRVVETSLAEQLRPDLADDDRFREFFDQWAAANPRRAGVPFRADLEAFAEWLSSRSPAGSAPPGERGPRAGWPGCPPHG